MDGKKIKTEAKVGIFVLLGIILLFYMTFKISGHKRAAGEGEKYTVKFNDVSGLVEKGKVEIAGVSAGWVDKIELAPDGKAELTIIINKNITLREDASAYIKTYGFMGEKYVAIYPGKSDKVLQSGGVIKYAYNEQSIAEVANKISEAADEFKGFMKKLNEDFSGKNGKNKLSSILDNFEKFSKDLEELMSNNKNKLQKIVDNVDKFSGNLSKSSNEFDKLFLKLDSTFTNLSKVSEKIAKGKGTIGKLIQDDTLYNNLEKTFSNLNEISEKINKGEGTIGGLINDKKFYNDIKGTFAEFRAISEKIAEGKGTLGKLVSDKSIYNDLKVTMANLKDITGKIKEGKGSIGKMISDDEMYKSIDKTLLRIQQAASGFSEQTPISTFGIVMGTLFSF